MPFAGSRGDNLKIGTAQRIFPLKWKLSLAFVLLSLALVSVYVMIAKKTFEDDKIAYVYETEQSKLAPIAKGLSFQIEQVVFNAATVLAAYDPAESRLGATGLKVFNQVPDLLAVEMIDRAGRSIHRIEKTPGRLASLGPPPVFSGQDVQIRHLKDGEFVIVTPPAEGATIGLRMLARLDWSPQEGPGILILSEGTDVVFPLAAPAGITELLQSLAHSRERTTFARAIGDTRFLVSTLPVGRTGLRLTSLVPESAALAALNRMYERSIYFLLLSVFATVIISMLLSGGLVKDVEELTETAARVQAGDLDAIARIRSNDEVGLLGDAFNRMVARIRGLLAETAEKSRMESELKTARAVQDTLFPVQPWSSLAFELDGYYESATECGGDFWFYWESGRHLYFMIGDVTGHGAAAALLTSAVRSTISAVKSLGESDLTRIVALAHQAVYDCSKGQRLMTAFFARLNLDSHELEFVNCSHEPGLLVSPGAKTEFLGLETTHRLGDTSAAVSAPTVGRATLKPGDTFFLYTDGLSEISDVDGKRLRERVFLKKVSECLVKHTRPRAAFDEITAFLKDFSKKPLEDDLTMVGLKARYAAGFARDLES